MAAACILASSFLVSSALADGEEGLKLTPSADWITHSRQYAQTPENNEHLHYEAGSGCIGYTKMGDAVTIPDVDFGETGYSTIGLEMANDTVPGDSIEIAIGGLYGELVATVTAEATGGWDSRKTFEAKFNQTITGVHDLTIRFNKAQGNLYSVTLSGTPDESLPAMGSAEQIVIVPTKDSTGGWEITPAEGNPEFGLKDNDGQYYTFTENGQHLGYAGPGCKALIKGVDLGEGVSSVTLAVSSDNAANTNNFKVSVLDGETVLATANVAATGSSDNNLPRLTTANFDKAVDGSHDIVVEWLNAGNVFAITLGGSVKPSDPPAPPSGGGDPYEEDGRLIVPASTKWELIPGANMGKQLQFVADQGCIGYNKQKNIITSPELHFNGKVYKTITMEYAYPNEDGGDGKVDILLGGRYGAYLCTMDIPATASYEDKTVARVDLPVAIPEGSKLSFRFYNTAGTIANVFNVAFEGDGSSLPAAGDDLTTRLNLVPNETWDVEDAGGDVPALTTEHEYYLVSPYYGVMGTGDVITVPDVNFGDKGFAGVELYCANDTATTQNNGKIEVLIDGKLIASVDVKGTRDWWTFSANSAKLTHKVTGTHDVQLRYVDCGSNLASVTFYGVAAADLPDYSEAGGGTVVEPDKVTVEEVTVTMVDGEGRPLANVDFVLNGLVSEDGSIGEMLESAADILDKSYTTDSNGRVKVLMVRGETYVLMYMSDVSAYGIDGDATYEMAFSAGDTAAAYTYDAVKGDFAGQPDGGDDNEDGGDDENPETGVTANAAVWLLAAAAAGALLFMKKKSRA